MEKECFGCHDTKSIAEFGPSTRAKDGHTSRCRSCLASYRRERKRAIREGTWKATAFRAQNAAMREQGMKRCPRCASYKPLDDFWRWSKSADGRQAYCACCLKAERKAKPEVFSAIWKRQATKARLAVFDAYGGRRCACCGETTLLFLTIDHIEGGGAAHRKEVGAGRKLHDWLAKHGFPPGYQILCFNCNSGRQLNGGICPHVASQASQTAH